LRVLVAHNHYRSTSPSGENSAVRADIELLREAGVEVLAWLPTSDSIADLSLIERAELAVSPLAYPPGRREMRRLLDAHKPDLVHIHNVTPFISASAVSLTRRLGIPVVQTMHNYRIGCMAGTHLRHTTVCRSCIRFRSPLPGVLHGCYRESRLQSAAVAAGQLRHHRLWRSFDQYIALTPFMRQYLLHLQVPEANISLRPTWAFDPGEPSPPGRDILFAGRLDIAKGVPRLLDTADAIRGTGRRLRVAGSGPLAHAVAEHPDIDYLGQLVPKQVAAELSRAGVVVLPSICFEGLPLILVEALAHGRAVVVPHGISPATVVDDRIGWIYDGTTSGLRDVLRHLDEEEIGRRGAAARRRYTRWFSAKVARESLLSIYRQILEGGAYSG
jgi:glycosyltransferase involved in cell wall biosynthesis